MRDLNEEKQSKKDGRGEHKTATFISKQSQLSSPTLIHSGFTANMDQKPKKITLTRPL